MKILALDTSSAVLALGFMEDGIVRGELIQNRAMTHSEHLMPHIEYLCSSLGESVAEIDLFATTVGPGSFTGVRIGVATANAFALATGKRVVGISTLQALAYNFRWSGATVIATMYAQREDYYRAIYRFDHEGELIALRSEEAVPQQQVLDEAKEYAKNDTVILTGELAEKFRTNQKKLLLDSTISMGGAIIQIANEVDSYIRGGVLCSIAESRAEKAQRNVAPVYIRKPQAEVQYEENQRKKEEAGNE